MTQLASAAIALALLGYSYRRFRGAYEALAAADDFGLASQPARAVSSAACVAAVHPPERIGERREVPSEYPRNAAA